MDGEGVVEDPGRLAYEIVSGGEPLAVRYRRLEALAAQYPVPEVTSYFESLEMQRLARKQTITKGIRRAFDQLEMEYLGHQYPGPKDRDEEWGWIGPYAWSEADYQHRFATLLEQEFPPLSVHLEMPINERMRSDLEPLEPGVTRRRPQFIDIVIADPTEILRLDQTPQGAGAAFRGREHEAFIEVKWFPKAAARWEATDSRRFAASVPLDLARLKLHRDAGRCTVAAMVVVDDRGTFMPSLQSSVQLPDDVVLLVLSPSDSPNGASAEHF